METIIELGGKKYKVTPVEEKKLEDYLSNEGFTFDCDGTIYETSTEIPNERVGHYPNEEIAEKVMLYGLLCSIAHKLNNGKKGDWYFYMSGNNIYVARSYNGYSFPFFATKELAEQAIRIFENSKFDLKKLFQ